MGKGDKQHEQQRRQRELDADRGPEEKREQPAEKKKKEKKQAEILSCCCCSRDKRGEEEEGEPEQLMLTWSGGPDAGPSDGAGAHDTKSSNNPVDQHQQQRQHHRLSNFSLVKQTESLGVISKNLRQAESASMIRRRRRPRRRRRRKGQEDRCFRAPSFKRGNTGDCSNICNRRNSRIHSLFKFRKNLKMFRQQNGIAVSSLCSSLLLILFSLLINNNHNNINNQANYFNIGASAGASSSRQLSMTPEKFFSRDTNATTNPTILPNKSTYSVEQTSLARHQARMPQTTLLPFDSLPISALESDRVELEFHRDADNEKRPRAGERNVNNYSYSFNININSNYDNYNVSRMRRSLESGPVAKQPEPTRARPSPVAALSSSSLLPYPSGPVRDISNVVQLDDDADARGQLLSPAWLRNEAAANNGTAAASPNVTASGAMSSLLNDNYHDDREQNNGNKSSSNYNNNNNNNRINNSNNINGILRISRVAGGVAGAGPGTGEEAHAGERETARAAPATPTSPKQTNNHKFTTLSQKQQSQPVRSNQQQKLAQQKQLSNRDAALRAEASRGAESDKAKSESAYYENQKKKDLEIKKNDELCRQFSVGVQDKMGGAFTSPDFPNNYPTHLNCTKIIEAPKNYTIKLEFREVFRVEQAGNDCDNDRIEIRDGRYGYSPMLARFCGNSFPREIMSTNEALLMRFVSDGSIPDSGFKGVYKFIPQQNSKPSPPNECRFNVARWPPGGSFEDRYSRQQQLQSQDDNPATATATATTSSLSPLSQGSPTASNSGNLTTNGTAGSINGDFASIYSGVIKNTDVPLSLLNYTREYNVSLECIWNITVMPGWKIYLTFSNYELNKPNDCESNFLEIYENELNEEDQTVKFCGTRTEPQQSKSNVFNIRHHALPGALGSKFDIVYTAFRDKGSEGCDPNREFDCDDGTCIHESLKCDGQINCKYRYDEASDPGPCTGADPEGYFFEAEHMVAILVIFLGLVSGMCASIYFSCAGKIKERRLRELEYHERRSREASMEGQLNQAGCGPGGAASKNSNSNQVGPVQQQPGSQRAATAKVTSKNQPQLLQQNHIGLINQPKLKQQQQPQQSNISANKNNTGTRMKGAQNRLMQQHLGASEDSMLEHEHQQNMGPLYNQQQGRAHLQQASANMGQAQSYAIQQQQQHHAPYLSHMVMSSDPIYNSRSILTSSLNTSFDQQQQQQFRPGKNNKIYDINSLMVGAQADGHQQNQIRAHQALLNHHQQQAAGQNLISSQHQLLKQQLYHDSVGSRQNNTTDSAQSGSQYGVMSLGAAQQQHQQQRQFGDTANNNNSPIVNNSHSIGYHQQAFHDEQMTSQDVATPPNGHNTMPVNLAAKYNALIRGQHQNLISQQQQAYQTRPTSTTMPRQQHLISGPTYNHSKGADQRGGGGGQSMFVEPDYAINHGQAGPGFLGGQLSSSVSCCNALGLEQQYQAHRQQQQQQQQHQLVQRNNQFLETPLLTSLAAHQQHQVQLHHPAAQHLYDLRSATLAGPRATFELLHAADLDHNNINNNNMTHSMVSASIPRSNSAHQLSRSLLMRQQQQKQLVGPAGSFVGQRQQQQHPLYVEQQQPAVGNITVNKQQQQHHALTGKSASDAMVMKAHQSASSAHMPPEHSLSYPHSGACLRLSSAAAAAGVAAAAAPTHLSSMGDEPEEEDDSNILPPPPLPPAQLMGSAGPALADSRRAVFRSQGTNELTNEDQASLETDDSMAIHQQHQNQHQHRQQQHHQKDQHQQQHQMLLDAGMSTDSSEPTIGMLVNQTTGPIPSLTRRLTQSLSMTPKSLPNNNSKHLATQQHQNCQQHQQYPPISRAIVQNGLTRDGIPVQQAKFVTMNSHNSNSSLNYQQLLKNNMAQQQQQHQAKLHSIEQQPLRDHSSSMALRHQQYLQNQSSAEMMTTEDDDDLGETRYDDEQDDENEGLELMLDERNNNNNRMVAKGPSYNGQLGSFDNANTNESIDNDCELDSVGQQHQMVSVGVRLPPNSRRQNLRVGLGASGSGDIDDHEDDEDEDDEYEDDVDEQNNLDGQLAEGEAEHHDNPPLPPPLRDRSQAGPPPPGTSWSGNLHKQTDHQTASSQHQQQQTRKF